MWCSNCRQDVPALAAPDNGHVRCTKCHQEIVPKEAERVASSPKAESAKKAKSETPGEVPSWAFVERPPVDIDTWRFDEDLLEAKRLVQACKPVRERQAASASDRKVAPTFAPQVPRGVSRGSAAKRSAKLRSPKFAFFAWILLSLGVMAFVFGGVLLGWSFWSGEQRFWTLGLPFTLGGQAALILGLIFQLDGLWQSNHDATVVLSDLDEQLEELRQATSLLSTSHSSHAQSFYFHLAEGASPHMLLSDLKGQLDLLAMRMAKDDSP